MGTPLGDRRQRAREAYYDRISLPENHETAAFEEAVETATRVMITQEILDAANRGRGTYEDIRWVRTILEAAGLEVGLHRVEREVADKLRDRAATLYADADKIDGGQRP